MPSIYLTPCKFWHYIEQAIWLLYEVDQCPACHPSSVLATHCQFPSKTHHAAEGDLLLQVRREEVRQQMLRQFKQSMAAPAWELEDYEWSVFSQSGLLNAVFRQHNRPPQHDAHHNAQQPAAAHVACCDMTCKLCKHAACVCLYFCMKPLTIAGHFLIAAICLTVLATASLGGDVTTHINNPLGA